MFKEGNYKHTILFSEAEQKKIDELQKKLNLTYKSKVIRYCVNKFYDFDYDSSSRSVH